MTPEQFEQAMKEIRDRFGREVETAHVFMDNLMCALLKDLGYIDGIKIYIDQEKYFS